MDLTPNNRNLFSRGSSVDIMGGLVSGVSERVLESTDWKLRTDDDPAVLKAPHRMPAGWTWPRLVLDRVRYLGTSLPIDERSEMDLGYVRFNREKEYVERLVKVDEEWVEEVAPEGVVDRELLLREGPRIMKEGVPPAMSAVVNLHAASQHMPMS